MFSQKIQKSSDDGSHPRISGRIDMMPPAEQLLTNPFLWVCQQLTNWRSHCVPKHTSLIWRNWTSENIARAYHCRCTAVIEIMRKMIGNHAQMLSVGNLQFWQQLLRVFRGQNTIYSISKTHTVLENTSGGSRLAADLTSSWKKLINVNYHMSVCTNVTGSKPSFFVIVILSDQRFCV